VVGNTRGGDGRHTPIRGHGLNSIGGLNIDDIESISILAGAFYLVVELLAKRVWWRGL